LGPAIGGLFFAYGPAIPFFAAAITAAVNFSFVFLLLPESLKEKTRRAMHAKLAFHAFLHIVRGLKDSLAPLFLLAFVWSFALSNNQINIALIGTDKFHLDSVAIGIGFTAMGIASSITQFFFIAPLSRFFGQLKIASAGLLGMAMAFFLTPLVPSSAFFLYGILAGVGFGSALAKPVITALITEKTTQPQGLTMGITHSFEGLGHLLGPLLGGFLFMFGNSVPFFFSAGIVAFSVIFVFQKARFIRLSRT
jgi:MFS family permease